MGTLIQGRECLPEWFDLSAYDDLEHLSSGELYQEVWARAYFASELPGPLENGPEDDPVLKELLEGYLQHIINSPCATYRPLMDWLLEAADATESGVRGLTTFSSRLCKRDTPSVASLTFHDLYLMLNGFELKEPLNKKELMSNLDPLDKMFSMPHRNTLYITVDPTAKDSEIIENFKLYLTRFREEEKSKRPLKSETIEKTLEKIIEYKVIPYLDLFFWSEIANKEIRQKVWARILYGEQSIKGADDFRKTTSKYASIAKSKEFMASCEAKFRQELELESFRK